MSLIVSGIKCSYQTFDSDAIGTAVELCGLSRAQVRSASVHKLSFDLRRGELHKVYSVELEVDGDEAALCERLARPDVRLRARTPEPRAAGTRRLAHPPVVCGFGPAGIFCALLLAEQGYRPVVLERGGEMRQRDSAVESFFAGGGLDLCSNIQFGEGGAGAYSDGKLTTRIGDPRCELVLRRLRAHGAPAEMMTAARPHVGTDLLKNIVVSMRRRIIALGGSVHFNTPALDFVRRGGRLAAVRTPRGEIPCETAVLAVGHSARDTFETLYAGGLTMEAKPFSVGVRIEHRQETIDSGLYGRYAGLPGLPPGEYFLSRRQGERGCYSFCMCPGGVVVAAASEEGMVVTNGMSYHARSGRNANAALAVSVLPGDFAASHPLAGVEFQRGLERAAFAAGGADYSAPVQCVGDFLQGRRSRRLGGVEPTYPRGWRFAELDRILPPTAAALLRQSIPAFGKKLPGFDGADAVLTGLETRTSSPLRIVRTDALYSPDLPGLIPCGEGAGYAGGIMSAAVDGIRAAERIFGEYLPLEASI